MSESLIDIGANLTGKPFDRDREAVIERAREAGVHCMIVTGTDRESNQDALALARQWPDVLYATAGVHPHHAHNHNQRDLQDIQVLVGQPEVCAVGETGLDYFRDFSPRRDQQHVFEAHLEIAADTGLPVFLHQREAHADFLSILERHRDRLDNAVVHCFTGDGEELAAYLDLDLYIGITGWICDERRGLHLRDIVGTIPQNRIMLETDCPYLLPRDLPDKPRNRRNEPAFLPHILRAVAMARGESPAVLAQTSTANARRFFNLDRESAD